MPISFSCSCGRTLRVADQNAGRLVRCPECKAVATVPPSEPQFEVVEDEPPAPVIPKAKSRVVVEDDEEDDDDRPRKKRPRDDDDDDDDERDEDRPRKKRRRDDDSDEVDERPRKKKRIKKRAKEQPRHFAAERGIANSGVLGGLAAMVGAAVWFTIGIMNDRIFIYPPILFIVGIAAVIKGLVGGGDDD